MAFRGSYVALITPFQKNGRVDWKTLEKLIEWHIASGTDGIVCCASTGEGATLSESERKKVAEVCIRVSARRVPVIASTGLNDTRKTVKATEEAQKLGVDGCLVVTPYYNRPTPRGCVLHFQEVAKVGLPLILYHNPCRAVVRLSAETIVQISQIPNVVGLKDAAQDIELIRKIRKMAPQFSIFSGDDDCTFSILQEGGSGVISVICNLIPAGWTKMIHLSLKGEWERAKILADRYMPLCKAHFLETNPQCIKFALSWVGKCQSTLRLPLVEPLETTQKQIKAAIFTCTACPQYTPSLPRVRVLIPKKSLSH